MKMDDVSHLIKGRGAVVTLKVYRIVGYQLNELLTRWKEAGRREALEEVNDALKEIKP